jgi:hypothetical protein
VSGSHAYGTNTPESDMDYRGVFMLPLDQHYMLFQGRQSTGGVREQIQKSINLLEDGFYEDTLNNLRAVLAVDDDMSFGVGTVSASKSSGQDAELQELRKFLKLAGQNNPNIIEFLWIEKGITIETPIWEKIRSHRDLFLSRKVCHTFAGYAHAQLHKIKIHRGYIMGGEKKKPTREEFGLPEATKIPPENQNALLSLPDAWVLPEMKDIVAKEKAFFKTLRIYKQYKEWETKRNPARRELEKKHGYDTKHAMHLVRLSRMAEEILRGDGVIVHRPDAAELNEIRMGKWSYEQLIEYSESLDTRLKPLYESSKLPHEPNKEGISKLYSEICRDAYKIPL